MTSRSKYAAIGLNLLVSVAISLVVNFSYLLLLLVEKNDLPPRSAGGRVIPSVAEGRLSVSPDGHGYLIYELGDSVYVSQSRIRRLSLADGDRLVGELLPPRRPGGHCQLVEIRMRNGEKFDSRVLYNSPSKGIQIVLQLLYYLLVSFIMLSILTIPGRRYSARDFARRCVWCLAAAAVLYFAAPVTQWPTGRLVFNFMNRHFLDYVLLLKCSFSVAVSVLYGRIYLLTSRKRAVELENEQLKNENLTTRYNMLVGQINPHFFFNSLNSLAMLVRERQDAKALTYIDQLSYTFRYIIQNGQNTMMPLDEELKFAEAYGYLFRIRYEDKIFFDLSVEERYRSWLLPALSLQPLIGNAVKHNSITTARPMRIAIRTEHDCLVVSNPIVPKLEPEPSMGIGLENLRNRWRLITGREIEITDDGRTFTVRLPLQKPSVR